MLPPVDKSALGPVLRSEMLGVTNLVDACSTSIANVTLFAKHIPKPGKLEALFDLQGYIYFISNGQVVMWGLRREKWPWGLTALLTSNHRQGPTVKSQDRGHTFPLWRTGCSVVLGQTASGLWVTAPGGMLYPGSPVSLLGQRGSTQGDQKESLLFKGSADALNSSE